MTARRGRFAVIFTILAVLAVSLPAHGFAQTGTSGTAGQPQAGTALSAPAAAQSAIGQRADAWKLNLDNTLLAIQRDGVTDEELAAARTAAEDIIEQARALASQIEPDVAAIQARLDQLGPAPGENDPPETPDIAERRRAETAALAAADATLKKVRLAIVQAEQVVREVAAERRDRFSRSLLVRNHSILNPSLWIDGLQDVPKVTRGFTLLITDSWAVAVSRMNVESALVIAVAFIVAIVIGVFVRRFMRKFAPPIGEADTEVPRLQKLSRAVLVMVTDGILPVVAIAVVYLALDTSGLLTPRLIEMNRGMFAAVASFSFLFGLARGICAPLRPAWRPINLSDAAAAQTVASVTLIAGVLAVGGYLETANDVLVAPVSVEIVKRALAALLIAALIASALRRLASAWREIPLGEAGQTSLIWQWMHRIIWLSTFAIFAALITGFIALANFLAIQLVLAGAVFAIVWLLLGLIEETVNAVLVPTSRIGSFVASAFGISESGVMQLALVASGLLRILVVICGAVLVMLPWGFDTGQWNQWIQNAFFGFRIGGVTISLSSILGALIVLVIGLVATRAIQSWLANRFLPNTQLDLGLRNSIRTIAGYAGVILAAILSVTYMGLNLENVALLAGALSVGIGFGLQSIVSNFVSGLILLAERPIKEGDWIVVGAEQGNVRKISIRSTEIETFDRATVIVPNSDLITGTVKNWMHSNMMGRVVIPIGVAYGADPEAVRDILLDIARGHPNVLAYPEPRVYFMDFGDSSLVFNLFAYIGDVNNSLTVRSDFRFEILKRFREASIEIPFPQRDINLRDIDRLEEAIGGRSRSTEKPAE